MYERYKDKDLVLLGLNCSDQKPGAVQFLRANGVTFPNILDTSEAARKVVYTQYQTLGMSAVPLEYIIDRDGNIAAGWYGGGGNIAEKTIAKLGIK